MSDLIYKFWYILTNCALLKSENGKIHKSLWWKKAGRWCVGRQTIGEKGKRGKKMAAVDSKTQKALGIERYSRPNTRIWRDFMKKASGPFSIHWLGQTEEMPKDCPFFLKKVETLFIWDVERKGLDNKEGKLTKLPHLESSPSTTLLSKSSTPHTERTHQMTKITKWNHGCRTLAKRK